MYHPVINLASAKSAWRGLDIYRAGKVLTCEKAEGNWFEGTVQGSAEQPYHVRLSLDHPRSSTCDCPHAKNRAVICKPFPMPRGTFFERSNWKSFSTTRP